MKNKKNVWKKADDGSAKTFTIVAVIAVALMLSLGIAIAQQTNNQMIVKKTSVEISDECPCEIIDSKIREFFQSDGGVFTLGNIPGLNETFLCEILDEPGIYEAFVQNAALFGCGLSFSASSQSYEIPGSSTQAWKHPFGDGMFNIGGSSKDSGTPPNSSQGAQGAMGVQGGQGGIQGGEFIGDIESIEIGLAIFYESISAEEIINRANQLKEWCSGGDEPTYGNGGWPIGAAMAFCAAAAGFAIGLPHWVISVVAWTLGMLLCLDIMVYSAIWAQIYQYLPDITQIYWTCVNLLTGGNYGP